MRFTLLCCILAGLLAATASAAPADPVAAASYDNDPQYAGCPAIGAGASAPQPPLCQNMGTPADYCSYYHATPLLESNNDVKTAEKGCLGFYGTVVDAQQLICDYERDANLVKSADEASRKTVVCARKIFNYYWKTAETVHQKIPEAYRVSYHQLTHLADVGAKVVKSEVNCKQDGQPDMAPGFLFEGVSAVGLDDEKKTIQRIDPVMYRFSEIVQAQFLRSRGYTDEMANRGGSLSTITGAEADGLPTGDQAGKQESGVNDPLTSVVKGTASSIATRAARNAAMSEKIIKLEDLLYGGGQKSAGEVLESQAGGLIISIAWTYTANGGRISKGDVAGILAVTGVSVVGGIVGAPGIVLTVATQVVATIADRLQAAWDAYDKKVAQAFTTFARGYLKGVATASSEQVAQAYRSQKLTYAYCSKCSNLDIDHGCPGQIGYAHGLNPDFYAPPGNSNGAFTNPWVKAAYDQYQQAATRDPSSAALPFGGAENVSPISTSPDRAGE